MVVDYIEFFLIWSSHLHDITERNCQYNLTTCENGFKSFFFPYCLFLEKMGVAFILAACDWSTPYLTLCVYEDIFQE